MIGVMQYFHQLALQQHLSDGEAGRARSASRLWQIRQGVKRDIADLGGKIDRSLSAVTFSSGTTPEKFS